MVEDAIKRIIKRKSKGLNDTLGIDLKLVEFGSHDRYLLFDGDKRLTPNTIVYGEEPLELINSIYWIFKTIEILKLNKNMKTFKHELGYHKMDVYTYEITEIRYNNLGNFVTYLFWFDEDYLPVRLERSENVEFDEVLNQAKEKLKARHEF